MNWLVIGFAALYGLVVGSFLNVVVYRIPNGLSVVSPPSACPNCKNRIRPRDNIPILGWVLLKGKCRDCGEPISIRYLVVEAATAILFGATAAVIGLHWTLPAYLWFVGVTFALALVDLDTKRLPNRIMFPGTIVGAALLAVGAGLEGEWRQLLTGLAVGAGLFVFFLLLALAVPAGFGMGDVKLIFILGLFSGYVSLAAGLFSAFAGFFIGGLISVLLLVTRRANRKTAIPFGPSLVAGSWLAIAAGTQIVDWYLGF